MRETQNSKSFTSSSNTHLHQDKPILYLKYRICALYAIKSNTTGIKGKKNKREGQIIFFKANTIMSSVITAINRKGHFLLFPLHSKPAFLFSGV